MTRAVSITDLKALARGRWPDILETVGGIPSGKLTKRHQPCPNCGGRDRYRFDDKHGNGDWYCNKCGGPGGNGGSGDGFDLLTRVRNWTIEEAASAVAQWLGDPALWRSSGAAEEARREWRAREQERQDREDADRRRIAAEASDYFGKAIPLTEVEPDRLAASYWGRKGLRPDSRLRLDAAGNVVVPVASQRSGIVCCQTISPDGEKRNYPTGSSVGSGVFYFGSPNRTTKAIAFAEGAADAASIFEATGWPTFAAFGTANFEKAIERADRVFDWEGEGINPQIYVCADNDEAGRGALERLRGRGYVLVVPPEPGDFDDLRRNHGPDAVRVVLEAAEPDDTSEAARKAGKAPEPASEPNPSRNGSEAPQRRWRQLVSDILDATMAGDLDEAMDLRTEAIARYRRTDTQIDAALFRLLTEREIGSVPKKSGPIEPRPGVDMTATRGIDYRVPGFVIDRDQTMITAAMGTGKTTAALALLFAALEGSGFLDQGKPAAPVLADNSQAIYIASDSDASPIKAALQDMGLDAHPWVVGDSRRLQVWAHDPATARTKWIADITGCLELLAAVKARPTALVVIDSCKAVFDAYCDNSAVTALLTFFKSVICQYAPVVWLNHDGKERGAGAGAKAWREVPSICHHIERVDSENPDEPPRRRWSVIKDRICVERRFDYVLNHETGQLEVLPEVAIVKDATEAILETLRAAWRDGVTELHRGVLLERIRRQHGYSNKSIDNTLTRLTKARHPVVTRPPGKRGVYKLAPRLVEEISDASRAGARHEGGGKGKEKDSNPVPVRPEAISLEFPMGIPKGKTQGKNSLSGGSPDEGPNEPGNDAPAAAVPDDSPDLPSDFPREFPRENEGKTGEAIQGQGLTLFPSQTPPPHVRAREAEEGDRPLAASDVPEYVVGSEWIDPSARRSLSGRLAFFRVWTADAAGVVLARHEAASNGSPVLEQGVRLTAALKARLVARDASSEVVA